MILAKSDVLLPPAHSLLGVATNLASRVLMLCRCRRCDYHNTGVHTLQESTVSWSQTPTPTQMSRAMVERCISRQALRKSPCMSGSSTVLSGQMRDGLTTLIGQIFRKR